MSEEYEDLINLDMVRGDDEEWDFQWVEEDEDGTETPIPITGGSIRFSIKDSIDDETALLEKTVGSGVEITDGPNGKFTLTIDRVDTEGWNGNRDYPFDIEITTNDLGRKTPFVGELHVNKDVSI